MIVTEISFDKGAEVMVDSGYSEDQFVTKWHDWIARGDVVLILQNEDMSSGLLGATMTMPWTETAREGVPSDGPFPAHGPDSSTMGLGWRFLTKYVIRKAS